MNITLKITKIKEIVFDCNEMQCVYDSKSGL